MTFTGAAPLSLAGYQRTAIDGLKGTISKIAEYHQLNPAHRREVALRSGVMLLQAPTASGKTLILGRTLEELRGLLPQKTIWFWFAPYSGLIAQTRDALAEQCGSLRLRDIYLDREPALSRDGDIFVQTWSSVAARNKEARKVRRTTESILSIDEMIAGLRSLGFLVGVVIDEAHLNFGASAEAAAQFYLQVLQPDFTILATATPNDEKLEHFERTAGIEVASRIVIGRGEVVIAGLNKHGLMLGYLRFQPGDADLIDLEQGTLTAAWTQHKLVKKRLAERSISVTPLMLVQVEDQAAGAESPIERVRSKLIEIGVPDAAIAVHTSGEPDPDFHTLAYDPTKEVLIFKVAVATGFDAPRAWTLVSVRPSRGRDFGLQIVGRIMRVHPLVRPYHGTDPILDRGYVFLTDADLQQGLTSAADELKAVRQSIDLITDRLDIFEFGNAVRPLDADAQHSLSALRPNPPANEEERQIRLNVLVVAGIVPAGVLELASEQQDKAIAAGEILHELSQTPLFGNLPQHDRPADGAAPPARMRFYNLRNDLGIPDALEQEVPPLPHEISGDLVAEIAREFCRDATLLSDLHKRKRKAIVNLHDLFVAGEDRSVELSLLMSNARIAEKAQLAFQFNDSIDPRDLKRSLVEALRSNCDAEGVMYQEPDLRRAIDLAVMREPERLRNAMRTALSRRVEVKKKEPIPLKQLWTEGLITAKKSGYGVFPERLNGEERAFAEFLDADETGTVKWWLRNPENELWATRLILPTGKRFFPDFAVGVNGRSSTDMIALVEIKDDGETGRLQSDRNLDKIRVRHRSYGNVFWTYRENHTWTRAQYSQGLHRIIPRDAFNVTEMVYLE